MKKLLFLFLLLPFWLGAQENYEFKEIKRQNATSVKDQGQTGTCWAFSSASFLESEAMRNGKGAHDLSEMYVVRFIYRQKSENYVRRMGKANLSQGGLAHDLLNAVAAYGVVPESIYPGRKDPNRQFNHTKFEKDLQQLCNGFVAEGAEGKLQPDWLEKVDSLLDLEFGPVPVKFTYEGTLFTPISFRDYLGIHPENYVTLTSFTHHPFYSSFILEIPDNFSNGSFYNLPLGDLMRCLNNCLQQGFTATWDADVSNRGFSAQNGLAIVPDLDWKNKDEAQRAATFKYWEPEKNITQEYRQQQFDALITQDDHLMHVVGMLDEAHSGQYYVVKNSWGAISELKGYVYASEAYLRLNTISITLHRDAIPIDIRQKLGLLPASPNSGRDRRQEMMEQQREQQEGPNGVKTKQELNKKPGTVKSSGHQE